MRRLLQRVFRRQPAPPRPLILMYHRVAAPAIDPWGLAVGPDRFDAHLEVLGRRRTVLRLDEMVERLESGALPENAVAITFDDGYVDNLLEALPRLERRSMPATLFLASGAIDRGREFWWDELARAILLRTDPVDCAVQIGGHVCRIAFKKADVEDSSWRAWEEPRTNRQRAYVDLWRRLRDACAADRDGSMQRLRDVLRPADPDPGDLPLSASQAERIGRSALFDIGGHTLTHAMLPALAPAERRREIAAGKQRCEEIVGRRITGFAYPHGALDDDCRAAVRESGFGWACGTTAAPLVAGCDVFTLPRFAVPDVESDAFERMLA